MAEPLAPPLTRLRYGIHPNAADLSLPELSPPFAEEQET